LSLMPAALWHQEEFVLDRILDVSADEK
jgi:hypothetical protein